MATTMLGDISLALDNILLCLLEATNLLLRVLRVSK